jgi:hypothetical protein
MPLMMAMSLLLMPIVFFGAVSFFGPAQSPFYHPKLVRFINSRYGEQACESFLVRLKPVLLFGVVSVLQGAIGLWRSYSGGASQEAYVLNGVFVSAGLAFALAHVTLYVRKAVGVFPTWTVAPPVHTATPLKKTTLREALRIYWWTLIGIGVFPLIFVVGGTFLHIPFEFFILPFLAVGLLAGWPFLSGKVPYSFWLVAMALWLVGGICAGILMQLINMFLA